MNYAKSENLLATRSNKKRKLFGIRNIEKEVTIIAKTENGLNQGKSPRYIECREDGVLIYPSQEFVPFDQLKAENSPLTNLITEVKNNKDKEYVIVAIRPQGIKVFKTVRSLIEKEDIDIGYEPIEDDWILKIEDNI